VNNILGEKENTKPNRTVDVIGFYCPEPMFRTRLEMDKMDKGEVLEVLADDPSSESDITSWIKKTGQELLSISKKDNIIRFIIRKNK